MTASDSNRESSSAMFQENLAMLYKSLRMTADSRFIYSGPAFAFRGEFAS